MDFDLISFGLGALLSGLSFLLTYKPRWRNFITREFTVRLLQGTHRVHDTNFTTLELIIELRSTHAEDVQIIDVYFKFSEHAHGIGPNSQILKGLDFNQIQSHLWRNFQDGKPLVVNKFLKISLDIGSRLRDQINDRTLTYLYVIVRSNKYGKSRSKKLTLKYPEKRF